MHFDLASSKISDVFRGAALIRGRRLFQCGHPKVRRLIAGNTVTNIDSK